MNYVDLPERIGLKPLPFRDKLKEDYSLLQSSSFQVEVAVNSQQSTINSQQSTVNSQQSTVNSQQSTDLDEHKNASFLTYILQLISPDN